MRTFAAVSTCHAAGYETYGRQMLATFERHWPAEVPLLFYTEGFTADVASPRILCRDLAERCPDLMSFKARHADNPLARGATRRIRPRLSFHPRYPYLRLRGLKWGRGYRWNAVRVAHKTFALFDAARTTDADVLIWVDADSLFFADVTPRDLEALIPPDCFVGYLRRDIHSECGFVAYNLRHPATRTLLERFERLYREDTLFAEYEFHDSYLFDVVRRQVEREGHKSYDIAQGIGLRASHVLINSTLGRFMDHIKGGRKALGGSHRSDLIVERPEPYWQAKR